MSMKVLPLTICWRCPRSVILEAQKIVPDIEWAPDAQEGSVSYASELPEMLPTDALLCRNTAPLIEYAYALLRQGVACKVEGREIGSGLLRLVNRWKVTTIDAFLTRLSDYREREIQKPWPRAKTTRLNRSTINAKPSFTSAMYALTASKHPWPTFESSSSPGLFKLRGKS